MTVTTFPLNPRTALSDLIAKVFSAPFAKTFSAPLGGAAAAAVSWFLSGGIAAANCIAAYDAKNAVSLAASCVNLAKPGTYDLTYAVAPTQTPGTGWTFSVSNQLFDTGIVPSSTSWSMIARFSSSAQGNVMLAGAYHGETQAFLLWPNITSLGFTMYNGGRLSVKPALANGVISMSGNKLYRNGIADAGTSSAGTAVTITVYIGGVRGLSYPYVGVIEELAIYDIALDAPINLALYTAIAAL